MPRLDRSNDTDILLGDDAVPGSPAQSSGGDR